MIHHIIFDGWSIGIFTREVGACYEAYLADAKPGLPALPGQYADYARWQIDHFDQHDFSADSEFWMKKLAGIPSSVDIPFDRPRQNIPTQIPAT